MQNQACLQLPELLSVLCAVLAGFCDPAGDAAPRFAALVAVLTSTDSHTEPMEALGILSWGPWQRNPAGVCP